ncbi:unnamed protein product [Lepeophtheirus salmonis]|uniref:(salmon louse) hypothetical protein n=1 Tax=Lepeophtheirus salmonis TaxID=72036 RepID=A0A7R8CT93_LEPSM|nr:unnamed protein product [Lepeophtheirus salmonis]CAF2922054.1 unnamed protein product [Lepeophtheirus salmonis]
MSDSKNPSPTSLSSSDFLEVYEEGETPPPIKKTPIRKRRLVMLCNTIGFCIVLTVITISLSLSSSEETNLGSEIYNQSSFDNETADHLPTPEARYSKRKFVAFMPISVNHDDIDSFSRLDYYDNEENYFEDTEEDRFGSHGIHHRLHRRPSRRRKPYRKKHLTSVMSLPRIRNRATIDNNNSYKKKNRRVTSPKKYLNVPDLHKRPGPPYQSTYNRPNSPLKRVSKPRSEKKKTPSTLIIIDKRKQKKKKNRSQIPKYDYETPYKNPYMKKKISRVIKKKKIKPIRSYIRRPPPKHPGVRIPGVRYPPNSGNIRDIIDSMHSKTHEERELVSNAAGFHHTAHKGHYYTSRNPPKNSTWTAYYMNSNEQGGDQIRYVQNNQQPQKISKVVDRHIKIPQGYPVHSLGFDPTRPDGPDYSEVTSIKKSSVPLSIGLDVYPIGANGHSKSSSSFSNRHGANKQEVLLHLNLFSNKPQVSKISSSQRPVVTSVPKLHLSKKPHLPTSYYYFSTPGSNNYHRDNMYHPAQSSSLVSTHKDLNRKPNNDRVDSGPSPEDILSYLASGINEGNFRIGNHEIKISTNIENTSTLMDHHRLNSYLKERTDDDIIKTRKFEDDKLEAQESSSHNDSDNDVSTTRGTSSPIQIDNQTENGDFEYYYQYYYDYVYPEEIPLDEAPRSTTSTADSRYKRSLERQKELEMSYFDEKQSFVITRNSNLLFCAIHGLPSPIQYSLQIFHGLTFKLCYRDSIVAHNKFQHVCSCNKIQTLSQVRNLLAFVEVLLTKKFLQARIEYCITILNNLGYEEKED